MIACSFRRKIFTLTALLPLLWSLMRGMAASAAETAMEHDATVGEHTPGVSCIPVAERADAKLGCFIVATELLGKLPNIPVFWHLYSFPTRASAEAAKGGAGSVVESYGKVWLFRIAAADWKATGGQFVSRVGPLPVVNAASYTVAPWS